MTQEGECHLHENPCFPGVEFGQPLFGLRSEVSSASLMYVTEQVPQLQAQLPTQQTNTSELRRGAGG